MGKHTIVTILVVSSLVLCTLSFAANKTVGDGVGGDHIAYVFAPYRWDADRGEDEYRDNVTAESKVGQQYGYVPRLQTIDPGYEPPNICTVADFYDIINNRTDFLGTLLITTHGGNNKISIEPFKKDDKGEKARTARYEAYLHGTTGIPGLPVFTEQEIYKSENDDAYAVGIKKEFIHKYGRLTQSLVYVGSCWGSTLSDDFVDADARVSVGNIGKVKAFKQKDRITTFFRRMNGREGQKKRPVGKAMEELNLDFEGKENTTLAPSVKELIAPCPIKAGDLVVYKFDTTCNTDITPDIIGINCTIEKEKWIGLTKTILQGECTAPPAPGAFQFTLKLPEVTTYSEKNISRLDGNDKPKGSNAEGPAHDDYIRVYDCTKPKNPEPADREREIDVEFGLNWKPGAKTDTQCLYFGTVFEDVNSATPEYHPDVYYAGLPDDVNTYDLPWTLDFDTTYYWRVDGVNDPCIWTGGVWSFTTANYKTVDDFNHYCDANEMRHNWKINAFFEDYIDSSCSTAGGGAQLTLYDSNTLSYTYDNNDSGGYGLDYFSEIRYEYNSPVDWTYGDIIKSIELPYKGYGENSADPNYDRMWIAVEDSSGNMAVVMNLDPNAKLQTNWTQWNIDLRDFTGVDLEDVNCFYIGFGQRCNSDPNLTGGTGTVLFDNIKLHPARCIPEYASMDFTGDCVTDYKDLEILARDWLLGDHLTEIASDPNTSNLQLYWKFNDGNDSPVCMDSSGNGNYGTVLTSNGYPRVTEDNNTPEEEGLIDFYYEVGGKVTTSLSPSASQGTIACWIKPTGEFFNHEVIYYQSDGYGEDYDGFGCDVNGLEIHTARVAENFEFYYQDGTPDTLLCVSGGEIKLDQWQHCAATWQKLDSDTIEITIFLDGKMVGHQTHTGMIFAGHMSNFHQLGCTSDPNMPLNFHGMIDGLRIYDRALTEGEIMYLSGYEPGEYMYYPVESSANVYNEEPLGSRNIDFYDFALFVDNWNQEMLWPDE